MLQINHFVTCELAIHHFRAAQKCYNPQTDDNQKRTATKRVQGPLLSNQNAHDLRSFMLLYMFAAPCLLHLMPRCCIKM